jgi:REP element-mobilizing transposase RayT
MDRIYPHRLSTRMPLFDYGQSGAYFVSLVAIGRQPLFGRILNNAVQLSDAGLIVREEWLRPPLIRPGVYLDDWTIMPDHFHAILIIDMDIHRDMGTVGAHRCAPAKTLHRQPRTLGSVIAQFKATTTKCINDLRGTPGEKVWQRGYNDRVIRNEVELDKLREYIQNNARFQGHNL